MRFYSILCLFILPLCVAYAVATPTTLTIHGHIPWTNQESYTPVLIFLESSKDDIIHLNANSFGSRNISAKRSVEVKAGQKQTITLLLPTSLTSLASAEVNWYNTSGQKGSFNCNSNIRHRHTHVILFDRDNSLLGNNFLNNLPEPNFSYSGQRSVDLQASALPDYWQGIPLWLTLILTPTTDKSLTQAQTQALKQWHRAGGTLFVSTEHLQKKWDKLGVDATVVNENINQNILRATVNKLRKQDNARIKQHRVPGTDKVPVVPFVIILLLFIAIVGPLNYWWVRKLQQIHLFLITTPIISTLFCIVLAIFGLLADGLSSHRSVVELTWLNQQRKHACTWNSISWFSGLSPGDFSINADSEIRILNDDVYDDSMYNEIGLNAEWSTQQNVGGDWLLSRTHQQIQFTTPRTEERRFLLTMNGNTPTIKNGFDRDINHFVWIDRTGRKWVGENIESGQSMPLKPSKNTKVPGFQYTKRFDANAQQVWTRSEQALHFRASMRTSIHDIPGPSAQDQEGPSVLICGPLTPMVKP